MNMKNSKIYGKTGLTNTINTCYMNSAIQALSHNYPFTNYLFKKKEEICNTLLKNARKILKEHASFKLDKESIIDFNLKQKIQNETYQPSDLTEEEQKIVLNHMMTFQLIRLLENMWQKNRVVQPTSFRKVFCDARDKFFFGNEQHDSEEAYSCILQQIQEELSECKNIKFNITDQSLIEFFDFQTKIREKQNNPNLTNDERYRLKIQYIEKKKQMPRESIIMNALSEMKKHYDTSFCKITEIFTGFLHSSTNCPNDKCKYSSNKFDPFLHLSISIPEEFRFGQGIKLEDCLKEYCKEEILDQNNLWFCEGCGTKVEGIKRLQLWTTPPVLVIQLKRFGYSRTTKDNRLVTYPLNNFDVGSLVSPHSTVFNKCTKYRLQCVVNHVGGLLGGHYYTYCMDEDTEQWFKFDDKTVTRISNKSVVTKAAYLLFYLREDLFLPDKN